MKILSITGENKNFNWELSQKLSRELQRRRFKVALWQKDIDLAKTDNPASADMLLTDNSLTWPHKMSLSAFLPYLSQDFLIINGHLEHIPELICSNETALASKNWNNLTIAAAVISNKQNNTGLSVFQIPAMLPELADHIIAKLPNALPFPEGNPCCGACGKPDCPSFLPEIIADQTKIQACALLQKRVEVKINGFNLSLVQFAQDIVEQTLRGLLSTLDGYTPNSTIEINIKKPNL